MRCPRGGGSIAGFQRSGGESRLQAADRYARTGADSGADDGGDPPRVAHNPAGARLTFSSPPSDPSYLSTPLRAE
ncbi:hypothetical protein ACE14D_08980 [Streptomyces sp. Act-28]